MLLHGRQPAISLLCCSSTCSIASPWLRYLFMTPLLPRPLCCFSGSSGILCLLCRYPLSPLLLCLLCASLPTLLTSVCSVTLLGVQAACSIAPLRGTGCISLASITFLMNNIFRICNPSVILNNGPIGRALQPIVLQWAY